MNIVDTENSLNQPGWFVIEDINAKAAAAYEQHRGLFDDHSHKALCDSVEHTIKKHATSWNAAYHTARAQTRKQPAHTEVKVGRVVFPRGGLKRVDAALQLLGIASDDITYKPRSQSISVRVK